MASEESGLKYFTFTWYLENVSYCIQNTNAFIKSPSFVVNSIGDTKWKLGIYPRGETYGNYVGVYLHREYDCKQQQYTEIFCEFAFIAKDGSVLKHFKPLKFNFYRGGRLGCEKFEKREEVFNAKRSTFLPEDILTVRCRIWKSVGTMPRDDQCFARTRIGVQKINFVWNLKGFSTLESEKKSTYPIKSVQNGIPLLTLVMCVTGGITGEEVIRFEVIPEDQNVKLSALRLSLLDASGSKVECNQEEMWFDDFPNSKHLKFLFTKKKLMEKKSLYLPNDILSLHWDWTFSKGVVSEEIEEMQYDCATLTSKTSKAQVINDQKMVPLSHTLNGYLKPIYEEHFLSDVKLKTSTSIFPAHKVILGASSSVFKAMFSSDMKEKVSDCVDIEDLSDDTIRRMLLHIYTASMDELTWESASHLYVAGDKYAILSLKNICSAYLQDNLSPSNACEVLLVADFHDDGDLKSAVQDFILKHDEDIINSDEWKLMMETNLKLAAETLCLRYK